MSAYSDLYLSDAMRNLRGMLDYAVNDCSISMRTFLEMFILSGKAELFECGNPSLISGMSGEELAIFVIQKSGLTCEMPPSVFRPERSAEYWCGWILAYLQWETGWTFRWICNGCPAEDLLSLYPVLHETSEQKAASVLRGRIDMIRKRIYEVIEAASDGDRLSSLYDSFILITVILSLIPLAFKGQTTLFNVIDKITVTIFIIDYILRWTTADYKLGRKEPTSFVKYPFTPMAIVDLLSTIAGYSNMLYELTPSAGKGLPSDSFQASTGDLNALSSAMRYLKTMHYSYSGLKEQLLFEGYTESEASFGVDNCNANWKEQAAGKAQDYLNSGSFSKVKLILDS